jgi:hypothetical protein
MTHAGGMTNHRTAVLGIDIGRVIISATDAAGRSDTSFLSGNDERALQTRPSPGAFEAIAELVQAFQGRVWLVSKCGPRIQQLTRRWLERQGFFACTGLAPEQVLFCLKRPEKREHCAAIGATHFVDDRLDVLTHLVGLVPHLYWFGHQSAEVAAPAWAQQTLDWSATRAAIMAQLAGSHAESARALGA